MQMKLMLFNLASRIARIGADPDDDDEIRLRKSLLLFCAFPFIFAGAVWGLIYIAFDEPFAGVAPLCYAFISSLSIAYFGLTRRYTVFCYSQIILILLLPFFLMIALGGFINGSAVILWSLISPLGALLFDETRHAPRWFLAFLGLVILSGLLQPFLRHINNLSPDLINYFFVSNIVAVSTLVFFMIFYFVGQKNIFQKKSDALLLNILPRKIAQILKNDQRTIADYYASASILFADMVDFTPMSTEMSPVAMVELLNEIFSHFDTLVEKHNLEKIKTIGDCYMVAAGVPELHPRHAQAILQLALEMRGYIQSQTFGASRPIAFRIGVNSGPVMAGVIGRKKFIYDLWGDSVNIASRMESHGQGGIIQITRATYELVKDDFTCEPHGRLNIKGRGEMEVWSVNAQKTGTAQSVGEINTIGANNSGQGSSSKFSTA